MARVGRRAREGGPELARATLRPWSCWRESGKRPRPILLLRASKFVLKTKLDHSWTILGPNSPQLAAPPLKHSSLLRPLDNRTDLVLPLPPRALHGSTACTRPPANAVLLVPIAQSKSAQTSSARASQTLHLLNQSHTGWMPLLSQPDRCGMNAAPSPISKGNSQLQSRCLHLASLAWTSLVKGPTTEMRKPAGFPLAELLPSCALQP